jgi:hypothetical protein
VSKFGSVRVLSEKNIQTGKKKDPKPNRNRPKPAGSGPVFWIKPDKPICIFWAFFGFLISFLMGFVMGF